MGASSHIVGETNPSPCRAPKGSFSSRAMLPMLNHPAMEMETVQACEVLDKYYLSLSMEQVGKL